MLRTLTAALVAAALSAPLAAGAEESKPRHSVHVITMGQGEELFTRFGHIALLVDDHVERTRKVYNYGTFDFSDPDLQSKYVRGFLDYWLSVQTYAGTIRRYRDYDREVVVRTLNLSAAQAAEISRRLEENALPENRVYAYRHYLDNCCTRIRDLIDEAVGGAIAEGRKEAPTGRTYRDWTRTALAGLPVMSTLILFSLGPPVDAPITRWHEQFLPVVVAEDLDQITVGPDAEPLVARKRVVVERQGPEVSGVVPTSDLAIIVFFFALFAVGLVLPAVLGDRAGARRLLGFGLGIWGLIGGLGGLALILYWTATTHYDTHGNENLLLFPVTHLWILGPGAALSFKARLGQRAAPVLKWYLVAALGVAALSLVLKLGPFIQDNYGFLAFAAACNAAALLSLKRTGSLG